MGNERDVAFTPSTGIGEIGQGTDFTTPASGSMSGDGASAASDSTTHGAKAKAREVAATARERAAEKVQDRINTQKHRATDSLESVAQSLRVAGEQLPETNGMSRYMYQAANQVDNLAAFLNNRELTELVDEVEDFARRQPALFVGGAFALGVLGARFLKSSRRNLDRGPEWGANYTSTPYAAPTRGGLGNTFESDYPTSGTDSLSGLGSTGSGSDSTGGFGTQGTTSTAGRNAPGERGTASAATGQESGFGSTSSTAGPGSTGTGASSGGYGASGGSGSTSGASASEEDLSNLQKPE